MYLLFDEFITSLCELLGIEKPLMYFDESKFTTKTMMALCDLSGKTIYLRKTKNPSPDEFFAIAHELRHIWQKKDEQLYFASYKPVEQMQSINAYNLQLAEIDANAFAGLIMHSYFHLTPLFKGLSEEVKGKIKERMDYIYFTEFSQ